MFAVIKIDCIFVSPIKQIIIKNIKKMTTQKITNNEELKVLVSTMDCNKVLFAIRTKGQIEVFETKRSFNKTAKTLPNAVKGELSPYNYMWYRF